MNDIIIPVSIKSHHVIDTILCNVMQVPCAWHNFTLYASYHESSAQPSWMLPDATSDLQDTVSMQAAEVLHGLRASSARCALLQRRSHSPDGASELHSPFPPWHDSRGYPDLLITVDSEKKLSHTTKSSGLLIPRFKKRGLTALMTAIN